jgi:hypothetical protein
MSPYPPLEINGTKNRKQDLTDLLLNNLRGSAGTEIK